MHVGDTGAIVAEEVVLVTDGRGNGGGGGGTVGSLVLPHRTVPSAVTNKHLLDARPIGTCELLLATRKGRLRGGGRSTEASLVFALPTVPFPIAQPCLWNTTSVRYAQELVHATAWSFGHRRGSRAKFAFVLATTAIGLTVTHQS